MTTTTKNISDRILLIILDGFGINPKKNKNAIFDAKKPNLDFLFQHYPFTTIEAGGELVGLPKGVAGNSEVGHMNLGAGKSVRQDLVRINEAIEKNILEGMPKFQELIKTAMAGNKRIQLMGLLSDGGVHSHINHLKMIIKILKNYPELKIFFHAFTDGRDTAKNSGEKYVQEILRDLTTPQFKFASMQGRSIGMDRDRRWEKIERCYRCITGRDKTTSLSPLEYIQEEYSKGIFDEFINPVLFDKSAALRSDDSMFFINFRPDRAIQITLALTYDKFKEFIVDIKPNYYLCMTPYVPDEVALPILFDKERISGGLSEYLSSLGKYQFKIAETEKYAHITYFFNGGQKTPFPNEEHVLIPSPKEVVTYDLKPEMSALLITDRLLQELTKPQIDFYLVNFANSDMVGHTGNYSAAIKAIEVLDLCVQRLVEVASKNNIALLITADHGNSDQMIYEDGLPHTSHTNAPVPVCLIHPKLKDQSIDINLEFAPFALKDIAPTVLNIMGLEIPNNFQGRPIFK